jgi:hypothetical protein
MEPEIVRALGSVKSIERNRPRALISAKAALTIFLVLTEQVWELKLRMRYEWAEGQV